MTRTLAHVSDLHVGRDLAADEAATWVADALLAAGVDEVAVTGDVTDGGRGAELAAFRRAFAPLADRLLVVPGNHDRAGDDAASALMPGRRVDVELRPGLYAVRIDSTAPHNARLHASHGALSAGDLAEVDRALAAAPRGSLVALLLHHHPLPMPEDHLLERLATFLGRRWAAELERGRELLEVALGRCDLVLHGHRHAVGETTLRARCGRALRVLAAGATPERGCARIVAHEAGRVLGVRWLELGRGVGPGRGSPRARAAEARPLAAA